MLMVASTSLVRLSTVFASMSGGRRLVDLLHLGIDALPRPCGCSRRSASARCRPRLPAPFSLALPVRSSAPDADLGDIAGRRPGRRCACAMTMLPICSSLAMRPVGAHQ